MTLPPVLSAEIAIAWAAIQESHPELPPLVVPETLIGQTSTACGRRLCFERLLHEAAHGLATARGIRETSRAGRYHNGRFLALAQELGLQLTANRSIIDGFSSVEMTSVTGRRYAAASGRLHRAIEAHCHTIQSSAGGTFIGPRARFTPSGGGVRVKAECGCRRSIRVVPSVLEQAPILCGACRQPFTESSRGDSEE